MLLDITLRIQHTLVISEGPVSDELDDWESSIMSNQYVAFLVQKAYCVDSIWEVDLSKELLITESPYIPCAPNLNLPCHTWGDHKVQISVKVDGCKRCFMLLRLICLYQIDAFVTWPLPKLLHFKEIPLTTFVRDHKSVKGLHILNWNLDIQ